MPTIILAYLSPIVIAAAMIWSARDLRRKQAICDRCTKCGYTLEGLTRPDACPECGTHRDAMPLPRDPVSGWIQRVAVALAPASVVLVESTTAGLWGRPAVEVPLIQWIAVAPFLFLSLTIGVCMRAKDAMTVLLATTVVSAVMSAIWSLVTVWDWSQGPQDEDILWPMTIPILGSVLYGVIFLVTAVVWEIARCVQWGREPERRHN